VAVVRQVAGLLLQYPDDALRRDLPILRTAVGGLPAPVGGPLAGLLDHLARDPDDVLVAYFVATFDLSRRYALHLTSRTATPASAALPCCGSSRPTAGSATCSTTLGTTRSCRTT
jgi:nitrate reductase assembly molybdenum cofactor insertion protein NarJ